MPTHSTNNSRKKSLFAIVIIGSYAMISMNAAIAEEALFHPGGKSYCITSPTSRAEFLATSSSSSVRTPEISKPLGMQWIPGGEFMMGTDDEHSYPIERPAHRETVKGFWIDENEVTNAEFKKFVAATGYITTAERPIDWEELKKQLPPGASKPDDAMLKPGSMVFVPPQTPVSLQDVSMWWVWVQGANWQHPEGPGSSIEGKDHYPVVHVSWDDAVAYAKWAGKRLPTEAEWEFASRGGLAAKRYAWGDDFNPDGKWMANTFQGNFPNGDSGEDGFKGLAPVKSFKPNGYGVFDMIGNVWEWNVNEFYDAAEPLVPKHITKGGSFLCSPEYCINYRPSARRGTAFDSGSSNIGFRCVKD